MEDWKEIAGYEGLYAVSSFGRVRSLTKGLILKPVETKAKEYYQVSLYKNKEQKTHNIHRLVANAFIENPSNKKEVNHKDGDKLNNNASNLEWSTRSENVLHSYRLGLQTPKYKAALEMAVEARKRKINQYTLDGSFVKTFESITAASKATGVTRQNISKVLCGERRNAGGFKWDYKEEDD